MGKDRFPCRSGKHIVVQPDDPTRRDVEFEERTVALRLHHRHLSLTASDHVDDLAG